MTNYFGPGKLAQYEEHATWSDHRYDWHRFVDPALEMGANFPWQHPFVEIGTRRGGGALLLMQAILDTEPRRPLITIDPYGSRPYMQGHERSELQELVFDDEMYRSTMLRLATFASEHQVNWVHLKQESGFALHGWFTEGEGAYWFNGELTRAPCFIFADGDHSPKSTRGDLFWGEMVLAAGGRMVFDDAELFVNDPVWQEMQRIHGTSFQFDGQMLHWRKPE